MSYYRFAESGLGIMQNKLPKVLIIDGIGSLPILVSDESTASYELSENTDRANTVCDDLSVENDCISQKLFHDKLISFDGDSGSQWLGSWI